jgi:hypothetical protein
MGCGFLNMIGWVLVRRNSVVNRNMRRLGFRRFLLPVAEPDVAGISAKLLTLAQVQQGMVCAYLVLILLGWGVFHANAGYYYLQLAHYLVGLFPGLTWP